MSELQDLLDKRQFLQDTTLIFDAIKKQRKFYFRNKPNVIFDRDTALLWYEKDSTVSNYRFYETLTSINANGIDGYKNWRLPTGDEFNKFMEPKCHYDENSYYAYYIEGGRRHDSYTAALLLLNDELQPENYAACTSDEKARIVVDIFVKNALEPIFDDKKLTEMFSKYYKLDIPKQLAEVQQMIDAEIKAQILSSKLDCSELKKNFDIGANVSPIRYAASLKNLTAYLIQKLDEYVYEKSAVIEDLQKISVSTEFYPDFENIRESLENFHADALTLNKNLTAIDKLENVRCETLPPFALVTELLTEKIRREISKVDLFEVMPDFVRDLCEALKKVCVEPDVISNVNRMHLKIKEKILDLAEYTVKNHLRKEVYGSTIAARILDKICTYNESLTENSDIKSLTAGFVKNMQEVWDILDNEEEFLWVRSKFLKF